MISYASSIDYLNTESSGVHDGHRISHPQQKSRIVELKQELMTKYQSIPREVDIGAICYEAAVRSGLAALY